MAKKNGKDAAEEAVSGSLNEIEAKSETKKRKRKEGVAATAAPEAERQSPKNLKNAENAKAAEEARKDAKKLKKERKANKATDGEPIPTDMAVLVSRPLRKPSSRTQETENRGRKALRRLERRLHRGLCGSFKAKNQLPFRHGIDAALCVQGTAGSS